MMTSSSFPMLHKKKAAQKALLSWYRSQQSPHPWRLKFAETNDPYFVWISEIMLQQTVIKAVIPVYLRFLKAFPDVYHLALASEDAVREAVRGLGYYRRFRMMHASAKILANLDPSVWPKTAEAWKELPGIGEYTGAAIASIAFQEPVAVLDGNVERVIARLIDWRSPLPKTAAAKKSFRALAQSLIDLNAPGDSNQGLMELGQKICTPTKPNCPICPMAPICLAQKNQSTHLAPGPKERPKLQDVKMELHIVYDRLGRVGLIQRSEKAKFLKGALGFPTILNDENDPLLPKHSTRPLKLGAIKHHITHHRITAEVISSQKANWPKSVSWEWFMPEEVEAKLIANLDRKAWQLARKMR